MPILRNPRHEAFAQGLAKGLAASEAYEAAGYKPHRGNAARMRANEYIRERVLEFTRAAVDETEATVERVLAEMVCLAFYNPVDVIRLIGGKLTDLNTLTKLPEDLQRCILGITPTQIGEESYFRIKFADKQKALDLLARHLQMFKGAVVVENVFKMLQEMSDEELHRRIAELEESIREATGPNLRPGKR